MTISWPSKPQPVPEPDPVPAPLPVSVTGPSGTVFGLCDSVAGVDRHIRTLTFKLKVHHQKFPGRASSIWQDLDALLDRRHLLELEAWLLPSDLPL